MKDDNYGLGHVCSGEIEIIICSLIGRSCITFIHYDIVQELLGCLYNKPWNSNNIEFVRFYLNLYMFMKQTSYLWICLKYKCYVVWIYISKGFKSFILVTSNHIPNNQNHKWNSMKSHGHRWIH